MLNEYIIDDLNEDTLENLEKFVNMDDKHITFIILKNIELDNKRKLFSRIIDKFNKINSGGETGIRTQERVAPLPVFKTGAFNRSAISPFRIYIKKIFLQHNKFFTIS